MDFKIVAGLVSIVFLFFYAPAPSITSTEPSVGPNNGTVQITLTGTRFDQATAVKLTKDGENDLVASGLKILSGTELSCSLDLKGRATGKWNIVVTAKNSWNGIAEEGTLPDGFAVEFSPPTVSAVEPKKSQNTGNLTATLSGTGFRPGARVILSGKSMDLGSSGVKVISNQRISCEFTLNGAEPGSYHVKVVNEDGKSGTLENGVLMQGPPPPVTPRLSLEKIAPDRGFNNGYILTKITGANFNEGASVKLLGAEATEVPGLNVKVESPSKISSFFEITGRPVGQYDLIVINPDGQKASLVDGFTIETFIPSDLNKSLKPVYFDLNKFEIRPNQISALEANLKILEKNQKLFILLGGHADERGTREYNLDLSAKRGEAIKKYLLERGISQEKFVIYSYGKDYPLKKGHDESSWRQNRRVDVMVWEARPTKMQGIRE